VAYKDFFNSDFPAGYDFMAEELENSKNKKSDIFTGWGFGAVGPPECHKNTPYAKKFKAKEYPTKAEEMYLSNEIAKKSAYEMSKKEKSKSINKTKAQQAEDLWKVWPDPSYYIYYMAKKKLEGNGYITESINEAYQNGAKIKAEHFSEGSIEYLKDEFKKYIENDSFNGSYPCPENKNEHVEFLTDEDKYFEEFAFKTSKGINYSLNTHTFQKGNAVAGNGDLSIRNYVKSVCVEHRASLLTVNDTIIENENGKLFIVAINFNTPNHNSDSIVYNFEKDCYFSIHKLKSTADIDGKKIGMYGLSLEHVLRVKQMDLLDWFLVRKAIYLERFNDKTNIKDVYDPSILGLSSLSLGKTDINELFKKDYDMTGDFDLIDLEDD